MSDMIAAGALFVGRLLFLAGVSALLAEAAARVGGGVLLLWRPRGFSALERFGVGLLLGWATVGITLLGLGLTGLFSAPAIGLAMLALLLGSRATYARRLILVRAAVEARALGPLGLTLLGVGLAPVLLLVMVPEFEIDCEMYHLGLPWQFLQAHRVLLDHIPGSFQTPLHADLTFTIPLLLGDERLAKWMIVVYFIAATAIFVARCQRDGMREAGWLGPLLFLSTGQVLWLVTTSKNDIPAAALFVAGILMTQRGRWTLGASLLGVCMAAKLSCAPLVAVWFLLNPPPRRVVVRFACWLLLPLVPWLLKTYLATGNPLYPFGYTLIPSFGWESANQTAWLSYALPLWPEDTRIASKLPGAWVRLMRAEHLLFLLVLPGMALLSRNRRAAWACVAASIVVLGLGHFARYYLPLIWLLSLLAVQELARIPLRLRKTVMGVLAVYALLRIGLSPHLDRPLWREAFLPLSETFHRYLSMRQETIQTLVQLKSAGRPGTFKVLSVGESRTYRFPARLVYGGVLGETPLIWQMAKASHHPAELRKKFRQLGTDFLMYNFVSAGWLETRYRPFPWNERALRLYVEFLRRYLTPIARPVACDYANGGFYVFRVLSEPMRPPAADVWFTPGAESVYGEATNAMRTNRLSEALRDYHAVLKLLPDVAHAWNAVGHIYMELNDFPNAYKYLKRFGKAGVMDSMNLYQYGAAAVQVGELDLAEPVLRDALAQYPGQHGTIQLNQAALWATRAFRLMGARQLKKGESWLRKAVKVLDQVPITGTRKHQASRRNVLAMVLGLHGEYELIKGNASSAAKYFRQAYGTAPRNSLAPRWKRLGG